MIFHGAPVKLHNRLLKLLQACSRLRSIETTKPLHALAITLGPNPNQPSFLHNNIIALYALLDELLTARQVFDKMPHRNVVSYNSMISAWSRHGDSEEAWRVFRGLMGCGLKPSHHTLAGLLSCASMSFDHGVLLLALAMKDGLYCADAFVGTAFLGLAGRCGLLEEAFWVFQDMPRKSLLTWNSMISLFGRAGFVEDSFVLFCELVRSNASLSECSFIGVLSGLVVEQYFELGKQVHGLVIRSGFCSVVSVMNSLINMYAKCASLEKAVKFFEDVAQRDVLTWNTIISALAKSKEPRKALEFFSKMVNLGIMPNQATYVSLISSCSRSLIPMSGEIVHAQIIIYGFEHDACVGSSLVNYYAKCDKLNNAHFCFLRILEKNVISWNALILGCANKNSSASVSWLVEMLQSGHQPNEFSFSAVLRSSTVLELQQLHSLIIRLGFESNEYVLSSLIKSYGSNGLIADALLFISDLETPHATVPSNNIAGILNRSGKYLEALKLLSKLDEPDIVSWNIVIATCARNGNYKEVIELFKHMQIARICPDNYTFVSLASVCCKLCDLSLGTCFHGLLIKTNFGLCDAFVYNVLIDMYGKCGDPCSSVKIFEDVRDKNIITWTALISALGINDLADEAVERFRKMESLGFIPDKVTFTAVLTACRNGALVREGMELFQKMNNYGVKPELDHYHCVVDLLATHGHLEEAQTVVHNMPIPPNGQIWRSFLRGCKSHQTRKDHLMMH